MVPYLKPLLTILWLIWAGSVCGSTAYCVPATQWKIEGVASLSPRQYQKTLVPFRNACLDTERLNALMQALLGAYFAEGLVGARLNLQYAPEKAIPLVIKAEEGKLTNIIFNQSNAIDYYQKNANFSGLEGKPLDFYALVQGVNRLNRLESANAKMTLAPGTAPGETMAIVTVNTKPYFKGMLKADNYGNPTGGVYRGGLVLESENALRISDSMRLMVQSARDTNAIQASGSFPMHNTVQEFGIGYSESLLYWKEQFPFFTAQNSWNYATEASLLTDKSNKLAGKIGVDWRKSRRVFYSMSLSPHRVTVLKGGLNAEHRGENILSHIGMEMRCGSVLLGASHDPAQLGRADPHAQFQKWILRAESLYQKGVVTFSLSGVGQYSAKGLPSAELIAFSGTEGVRGVEDGRFAADKGFLAHVETRLTVPGGLQPYVFSDTGHGRLLAADRSYHVSSVGLGIRFQHKSFYSDLTLAKPFISAGYSPKWLYWTAGIRFE